MRMFCQHRIGFRRGRGSRSRSETFGFQFFASFAVGFSSVLALGALPEPGTAQGRGPSPVVVAEVIEDDVVLGGSFLGTVLPRRTSSVGSRVAGSVAEFPRREGDWVREGEVIAILSSRLLRIELEGAKAQAKLRHHELLELRNGSRPEEIGQARARMDGAQSLNDYAQANLRRTEELFRLEQLTSRDALDEAVSLARNAEQVFQGAKASFELVQSGPREEVVDQALARASAQDEEVKRLEFLVDLHTIRAPFDGFLTREFTQVGAWLSQGAAVVEIIELSHVEVRIFVPEELVPGIFLGAEARVEIPSIPRESFSGSVSAIVPFADPKTRAFPIKVALENRRTTDGGTESEIQSSSPSFLLKAGMTAATSLTVGRKDKSRLIPKDALVLGRGEPVVYVVDLDGSEKAGAVRPVPVEVGVASGDRVHVRGDLEPGQLVVIRGNERLRPGQSVAISKAGGPPEKAAVSRDPGNRP